MARTRNFEDVIRAKIAANPDLAEAIEVEAFNADIAMKVYGARMEAGLTQKQLADRVGTQQSVISRMEDADYDGHSLNLLKRIARALGKKLRVEFCTCPISPDVAVTAIFSLDWHSMGDWRAEIHGSTQVETSTSSSSGVDYAEKN